MVKLPKLEITKFDVEKFNYLLGLLGNSPKKCVEGLTLNTENYEQAKEILQDRFGNPQVEISAHMDSLVKLPVVRKMDNVVALRKMYDHIESKNWYRVKNWKFDDRVWSLEEMMSHFKTELHAKEDRQLWSLYSDGYSGRYDLCDGKERHTIVQYNTTHCLRVSES